MNNIEQLIIDNMNLVYYIISKQYPTFIHDGDIIQSGMVGLCKAANYYNPERGLFSTYAGRCIRNEINQEFIRRKPNKITISLDTELGENGRLSDILIGDDDIAYIDDTFYKQLSEEEMNILTLDNAGFSANEISELSGYNIQKVRKILRTIKIKWRKDNGN